MKAMENMVETYLTDINKGVDVKAVGTNRKSELQALKLAAFDCRDIIAEIGRIEKELQEFELSGKEAEEDSGEYKPGIAEEFAK